MAAATHSTADNLPQSRADTSRPITIVCLFLAMFSVFYVSPVYTLFDSKYELLFSERLVWQHAISLDAETFARLKSQNPALYQIVPIGSRYYYRFPIGSVVLCAPFVAIANAFGVSTIDQNGNYDLPREAAMQKVIASAVCAAFVAIIFLTSRLLLSVRWSLLVSIVSGLSTQVWSTASRAVWSHTLGILFLAVAIYLVVRTEIGKGRLHPVLLGACLSWLYFIRPAFFPSILIITTFVILRRGRDAAMLVITGGFWLTAFMIYSYLCFGSLVPSIYSPTTFHSSESFLVALAGTLISPSRGWLVFLPWILFVGYLLIRCRSFLRPRLAILALAAIGAHIILLGAWFGWRGGHCYGPRLTTDIAPWLALVTILAIEARLKFGRRHPTSKTSETMEWAVAGLLIVIGTVLNGLGAIWGDTIRWNMHPTNVDYSEERVWDWKHPQFFGVPRDRDKRTR